MRKQTSQVHNNDGQFVYAHRISLYYNVLGLWIAVAAIYYSAVIELIIRQRPIHDILPGFLYDIWMPSCANRPLLYHCIITVLPLLSVLFILFFECRLFHHPWNNGKMDCKYFLQAEIVQKIIQYFTYALCAINICIAHAFDKFVQTPLCMIAAVSFSLPLAICILQGTYRLTFRRMANWAIASVNTLLYLTLLDCACIGEKILGLFGSTTTRTSLASAMANLPDPIKTGVVATVVIIILKDSIATFLSDITSRHPSNLAQRRRHNRRRLLTHWHYKKDATISSLENITVAFLVFESIFFAIAAIWIFVATGYARALVTASDKPPIMPFGLYLFGLALLIFIPSIMSVWTISDESLIQSEYTFLTNRAPWLRPDDIKESSAHWLDFCQVLVNLYNNVSGIESEDCGYHDLQGFLKKLHNDIGKTDTCASTRFFTDILGFKSDINAKLLRDSSHDEADDMNPQYQNGYMIQRARDVQFSHQLLALLIAHYKDQNDAEKKKSLLERDPLFMIMDISAAFFTEDNSVWGLRFTGYSLTAEEASQLLQMDTLLHILRHDKTTKCCLHKYNCPYPGVCPANKEKDSSEDNTQKKEMPSENDVKSKENTSKDIPQKDVNPSEDNDEKKERIPKEKAAQILQRIELSILYPLLVIKCYELRWGKAVTDEAFRMKIIDYYRTLINKKYSLGIKTTKGNDLTDKDICLLLNKAAIKIGAHWLDEPLLSELVHEMTPDSNDITFVQKTKRGDCTSNAPANYIDSKFQAATTPAMNAFGKPLPPSDRTTLPGSQTPNAASALSRARVSDSVYQNLLHLIYAIYYPTKEDKT